MRLISKGTTFMLLALAACGADSDPYGRDLGVAKVRVTASAIIPPDGECTHIIATRLSDFLVSEYQGPLAGAVLQAHSGDHRVTATAFPQPCGAEPAAPPWVADEQIVTFVEGSNTLLLNFRQNAEVVIDPRFIDEDTPPTIQPGSEIRTGRTGEDAAGPNYALDGWDVKQIGLPPGGSGETFLFSTAGHGMPITPRGMATTPDGNLVFQGADIDQDLSVFDAAGAFLGTWKVEYPDGMTRWANTDGLDAIDSDHFVRTGYLALPACDADGNNCKQSGIEILTKQIDGFGNTKVVVTQQIFLPEPFNLDYPVGVTSSGGRYIVSTLPADGGCLLIALAADGTVVAGPTAVADDVEGLFDDGSGRIIGLDFHGNLTAYNAADLSPRAGETASYPVGVGLSVPNRIAWRSAGAGSFIVLTTELRLVFATPNFDAISDVGVDLSTLASPVGIDYRPETDELVVGDLVIPRDPATGTRNPILSLFSLTSLGPPSSTVKLQMTETTNMRLRSVAYVPGLQRFVTHYRRLNGVFDPALEAKVFVHDLAGNLVTSFDLRGFGFARVFSVSYLPASDELLLIASDLSGTIRMLLTDRDGNPHRSFRTDSLFGIADVAAITSGPFAGDIAAVMNQPSTFLRLALP